MAGGTQGTGRMNFQVPEEMRTMAERSVTQARQALESYLQAARRTSESMEQTSEKVQAGTGHGPEDPLSGGAEPARLAGLCAAAGAGQGSARDHADPVRVRADPNGGHAGPDEGVRVGHAVRHGHREGPRAIGG